MAASYHQLGMVAQRPRRLRRRARTGTASPWRSTSSSATAPAWPPPTTSWAWLRTSAATTTAALDWYRQSLAINEQLGDRAGMASSYHQLGMVAQDAATTTAARTGTASPWRSRSSSATAPAWPPPTTSLAWSRRTEATTTAALDWYRQSLAIKEQLGNRAGMASTLSQIGISTRDEADGRSRSIQPPGLGSAVADAKPRSPHRPPLAFPPAAGTGFGQIPRHRCPAP